jgi:hypothetical protein
LSKNCAFVYLVLLDGTAALHYITGLDCGVEQPGSSSGS